MTACLHLSSVASQGELGWLAHVCLPGSVCALRYGAHVLVVSQTWCYFVLFRGWLDAHGSSSVLP